jgi:hypothetical protein
MVRDLIWVEDDTFAVGDAEAVVGSYRVVAQFL